MKKYAKIVQCDARGQIVIPKDIRSELKIEEGSGFLMYIITEEGILLKKIDTPELEKHKKMLNEINDKADKINVSKSNVDKAIKSYKKTTENKMELIE